jgi:hypothetical protein
MSAVPGHIHISEREADGSFEDCTWDSGLEFYRDAIDSSKPATHAEAQALRAASGEPPTGGSNYGDFRRGVAARYHDTLPAAIPAKNILTALKPGYCAMVQGSMSAFGPTHPLSVYDRNFDGSHSVYMARLLDGTLLWCDPEAPTSAAVPVKVTVYEVGKYVNAFAGQAIVAPIKSLAVKEGPVDLVTYTPGVTADVKSGSNVRSAPLISATKYHATTAAMPVEVIGTVKGDTDPANGSDVWYALWHVADKRVEYTAKDNVVNIKPAAVAVDDGFTKATQEAAVLAATEAGKRLGRDEQFTAILTTIEKGLPRL